MDDLARSSTPPVASVRSLRTVEAAAMCVLFAATYPERTLGLVLYNTYAAGTWAPDYPWASSREEWRQEIADAVAGGEPTHRPRARSGQVAASHADDPEFIAAWSRHERLGEPGRDCDDLADDGRCRYP